MKRGIELLCELYFAAGAEVVYPPVAGVPELRGGNLSPTTDDVGSRPTFRLAPPHEGGMTTRSMMRA